MPKGIAHQDEIDSGLIHQPRRGVIVSRQGHDFLPGTLHRREVIYAYLYRFDREHIFDYPAADSLRIPAPFRTLDDRLLLLSQKAGFNTGGPVVQSKLLIEGQSFQSWAIVFEAGEEVITDLLAFARQNEIAAASFTAVGAFANVVLGVFDWQTRQYLRIPISEQVEVVSVIGDILFEGGSPRVHAQAALAKHCGVTVGGHLLEGHACPMLQVILSSPPRHIERHIDEAAGLTVAQA